MFKIFQTQRTQFSWHLTKHCKKCDFPCTLQAVLGSYGIVIKCTAAIFFLMMDFKLTARENIVV